jgi:3-hydroxybutyryl-CoA dehydrogenase
MKVFICGAGTMGSGIAQVVARSGLNVIIYDTDSVAVDRGLSLIDKNLNRAIEKEKIKKEEKDKILARIKKASGLEDCREDVDFVIEAIVEDYSIKEPLFRELDNNCSPHTILSTNTSSLSISKMASVTSRPERVIGIHFFNPVPVLDLVEIVKGERTSDEVFIRSKEFVKKIGKTPVAVKDSHGFVVNRLLIPMINEAINLYSDGIASKEDIDTAMKLGCNHPIGPLALADLIGLDICLNIMEVLYSELQDKKYMPSKLLIKMVKDGFLGRKSKKGFYIYD